MTVARLDAERRFYRFEAAVARAVRRGRLTPSQALVLRVLGTMRLYRVDQAEEVAALLVAKRGGR